MKTREDKRPATTRKLNKLLNEIPESIRGDISAFWEFLNPICFRLCASKDVSKSSKSFKRDMNDFEQWADGFAAGSGREMTIISGLAYYEGEKYGTNMKMRVMAIIMTPNIDTFFKDLNNLITVSKVQLS